MLILANYYIFSCTCMQLYTNFSLLVANPTTQKLTKAFSLFFVGGIYKDVSLQSHTKGNKELGIVSPLCKDKRPVPVGDQIRFQKTKVRH